MARPIANRETIPGFLHEHEVRISRLERLPMGGGGGGGGGTVEIPDEVWVGATAPTDPAIELWYDPDAVSTGFCWPLVVKATEPTAADYGQATIPMHAVWIQAPS